jgi:xanthine dehydrogenase accessory factor
MKELLDTFAGWRAEGVRAGRAVVVRTFGSAPRPEGASLLYSSDGRLAGSVSGGCVEGAAAREIEAALASGRSRVIRYGISDEQAWDVGLACGGTIDVLIEPEVTPELIAAASADAGAVVITPLPADSPPPAHGPHQPGPGSAPAPRITVDADGRLSATTGDAATDEALAEAAGEALLRGTSRTIQAGEHQFFVEAYPARPRLVIVGAVEVARSLVALARELGFETIVVDGRGAFATRERFPTADRLVVAWPDEAADAIGLGPLDSVAVMTHDPKFDEPAIAQALRRGCRYVGAIGSRRTQSARRDRLRAMGMGDDELARLSGPIGLDLGGRAPAETALAILAEVVAARYGASGGRLSQRQSVNA